MAQSLASRGADARALPLPWFDEHMSRGTSSLVRLAVVSFACCSWSPVTAVMNRTRRGTPAIADIRCCCCGPHSPAAFGLSVPDDLSHRERARTAVRPRPRRHLRRQRPGRSGLHQRHRTASWTSCAGPLLVGEDRGHAGDSRLVGPGLHGGVGHWWRPTRSRGKAAIAILAEQDANSSMEDRLQHQVHDTARTRLVCRTEARWTSGDQELVRVNLATPPRSIIVRRAAGRRSGPRTPTVQVEGAGDQPLVRRSGAITCTTLGVDDPRWTQHAGGPARRVVATRGRHPTVTPSVPTRSRPPGNRACPVVSVQRLSSTHGGDEEFVRATASANGRS